VYVLVMPYLTGERQASKRMASLRKGSRTSRDPVTAEAISARKKQVQETLSALEAKQKSKKKVTLQTRLARAGLEVPVRSYYIASAMSGMGLGLLVLVTGSSPLVSLACALAGGLGLPRWLISFMAKRRQKKFLAEFANAIDIIVRGVKSGLPLNDCLQIIAREAPEPVRSEFEGLVEQQAVGIPVAQAFERMYERMPLQEVNFFAIVVAIQSQTGGNLAEALGNLSNVLRDRIRLQGKVAAFSAEAKTSAAIIGALPPSVMLLVYMSSPHYISLLWTTPLGKMMLIGSAVWMFTGIMVMRKMINFDY
ncbi:MAG: pilus assembly protein, partial [Alphaproteobacteria bacterium]